MTDCQKKLDSSVKEKWLEALRSGKYEQGIGKLCRNKKYCCLGVLCEVAGIEKRAIEPGVYAFGVSPHYLEEKFRESIGISYSEEDKLARMNDKGKSFKEIADYIEENL